MIEKTIYRNQFADAFIVASTNGKADGHGQYFGEFKGVRMTLYDQRKVFFKLADTEIYLADINNPNQRRMGNGTAALNFLKTLADMFNADIVLHASATRDDSPSDWQLREFYKKRGFLKVGSNNMMVRIPNQEGQMRFIATLG